MVKDCNSIDEMPRTDYYYTEERFPTSKYNSAADLKNAIRKAIADYSEMDWEFDSLFLNIPFICAKFKKKHIEEMS